MIKLTHLYKEYVLDGETFQALKDISLEIKTGEFTSLVGPSGCGKSTLMHIIGLLDTPTKGELSIQGTNISDLTDDRLSALRNQFVGFIFQQFNLINKLTVLENILLPTIYSTTVNTQNVREKALSLLDRFGIAAKAFSYPQKLSGGQQQRVAIARALINSPKVILADEPTGNLDQKTGQTILNLLQELNRKENITVLIVTHDENIAKKAKRQIHMIDGQIVREKK